MVSAVMAATIKIVCCFLGLPGGACGLMMDSSGTDRCFFSFTAFCLANMNSPILSEAVECKYFHHEDTKKTKKSRGKPSCSSFLRGFVSWNPTWSLPLLLLFGAHMREEKYVADRMLVRQEHHETINPDALAARGRHSIRQCADV